MTADQRHIPRSYRIAAAVLCLVGAFSLGVAIRYGVKIVTYWVHQ